MSEPIKMKPIIILPPKTMAKEDIQALRDNGICVVEAKDPLKVKFVDSIPIPPQTSQTQMEQAAIKLSRIVLSGHWGSWSNAGTISRSDATRIYVDLLVNGTPLDVNYRDPEIVRKAIFDDAKADALRQLARDEAKAERAAAKAALEKKAQ